MINTTMINISMINISHTAAPLINSLPGGQR